MDLKNNRSILSSVYSLLMVSLLERFLTILRQMYKNIEQIITNPVVLLQLMSLQIAVVAAYFFLNFTAVP